MKLFDTVKIRDSSFLPYPNTGTMLDVATGGFVQGMDGEMILNGGLGYTNAFPGRPQLFKSTTSLSFMLGAMSLYPDTGGLIYDSEFAQQTQRLVRFVPEEKQADVGGRLRITDATEHTAESFFELLHQIGKEKLAHRDEYTVESPFVDPTTGKARRIMIPTFVAIDSLSKLGSKAVQDIYDKSTDIGSSETNTSFMKDGLIKSKIIAQLPAMAAKYGMYFVVTAHVGTKIEMNPYAPTPKELQHMSQNDKVKHVGADFDFLMSNFIQMKGAKVLQDPNKDCLYPDGFSSPVDLNQVAMLICRCKNNTSGAMLHGVVSQHMGLLSGITNYHYLKENDYFGLVGSKITHAPAILPELKLGRTTVREKLNNYRAQRAIEIVSQLCYIRNSWNLRGFDRDFRVNIETFAEKLLNHNTYSINDILESRGWWTYDKNEPRPYLSIYDILGILEGSYKPKMLKAMTVAPTNKATPAVLDKDAMIPKDLLPSNQVVQIKKAA